MIEVPTGVIPVRDLTTGEVLYGSRSTRFSYELFEHNPSSRADSLIGYLDGAKNADVEWVSGAPVKKSLTMSVLDLEVAEAGKTRMAEVDLNTVRIRPVRKIEGLPDVPLGLYVVTAGPEAWKGTGRTFELELHEKTTVLAQDRVDETYTADTSSPILSIILSVVQSAGELILVDGSDARTLAAPIVWRTGTTKLTIVNDLLKALNYNSLWMDNSGALRATPYVRPADRSIRYAALNDEEGNRLLRELTDGARSIYSPEWTRDRDSYGIPNKVVATERATGDAEPLSGVATNENPDSPFSYQSRGNRWIVPEPLEVDVPDYSGEADPEAATIAFLEDVARRSLIARSAVQAAVSIECLPIPLELLEAIRFAHTPSGIDVRHTVRSVRMSLRFDAMMSLELQEVIDL